MTTTQHPIWWKILWWLWSRYTSESLDHTAQLGFHPPDILLICQPLLIPKVARSQYNPKPFKLSLSHLIHVSSLQYLLLLLTPSLCRTHPALLLLLTQGSVLSSVPVEGGCSPASVGWEWTQCHSPLSPGVQSTSHCCISEKQNEKSLSDKIPEFKYNTNISERCVLIIQSTDRILFFIGWLDFSQGKQIKNGQTDLKADCYFCFYRRLWWDTLVSPAPHQLYKTRTSTHPAHDPT